VAGSDEFPMNLQTSPSEIVRKAQFEEEGARTSCGGGLRAGGRYHPTYATTFNGWHLIFGEFMDQTN
jgi:hypothetical protein